MKTNWRKHEIVTSGVQEMEKEKGTFLNWFYQWQLQWPLFFNVLMLIWFIPYYPQIIILLIIKWLFISLPVYVTKLSFALTFFTTPVYQAILWSSITPLYDQIIIWLSQIPGSFLVSYISKWLRNKHLKTIGIGKKSEIVHFYLFRIY